MGFGTDAVCLEVQTSARVSAMAKAQPAKKAAKTVQKKATSVAKTARKTVRCGSTALSCNNLSSAVHWGPLSAATITHPAAG